MNDLRNAKNAGCFFVIAVLAMFFILYQLYKLYYEA